MYASLGEWAEHGGKPCRAARAEFAGDHTGGTIVNRDAQALRGDPFAVADQVIQRLHHEHDARKNGAIQVFSLGFTPLAK